MNSINPSISGILNKIRPLVSSLTPEDRLALIQAIASENLPNPKPDQLLSEQEAWFARPKSDRQRFAREFVAVHNRQVIDHDPDRRALYLRVRERFSSETILIVHADWDDSPVYTLQSPIIEN